MTTLLIEDRGEVYKTAKSIDSSVLGFVNESLESQFNALENGLKTEHLETVQNLFGITLEELADLLLVSPRTLLRRKKEAVLPLDESDRLQEILLVFKKAIAVLGSERHAKEWFKTENYALAYKIPLHLIRTTPGRKLIEELLHRIEHGIFV